MPPLSGSIAVLWIAYIEGETVVEAQYVRMTTEETLRRAGGVYDLYGSRNSLFIPHRSDL
jgi:hypothetical protein